MTSGAKMSIGEEACCAHRAASAPQQRGWWLVAVATLVGCLMMAVLDVCHVRQCALLESRVQELNQRLLAVEGVLFASEMALRRTGDAAGSRSRRSVVQQTAAGIPVVDRPYGHRALSGGRRAGSDGIKQRRFMSTYDDFASEITPRPPADSSLLPHHRSSAAFGGAPPPVPLGRVNTEEDAGGDSGVASPFRTYPTRSAPDALAHRRSRVPMGSRKKARSRKYGRKRGSRKHRHKASRQHLEVRSAAPGYAEPPLAPQALRQQHPESGRAAGRHHERTRPSTSGSGGQRGKRLLRMMDQFRDEMSTTAAHFEGHTTNYSLQHPHYGGNGLLRNMQPDGVFGDWREAAWMRQHGFSRDFDLYGSMVTVKRSGVYYVYAQINYLDDADINGFELALNGRPLAKCLTMDGGQHRQKVNTCFTAAATFLSAGDAVTVRDLEPGRISMFLPDRSFFGLVQLAAAPGVRQHVRVARARHHTERRSGQRDS